MSDTFIVPSERVQWPEATGDIPEAYSADRISEGKPIREPFSFGGHLWCCISISGAALTESKQPELQCYRIVPPALFHGVATTYREKVAVDSGEAARSDPLGFYDSMRIVCGGKPWIMRGPPATFVADAEAQRPEDEQPEAEQMTLGF